ncbi:MAG: hypothetical protein MJ238_03130 [Bacilli bacterium]|nr:hypothetical protein [Bacilli bacterium]
MDEQEMYKPMSFAKGSLVSTIIYLVEAALLIAGGVISIIYSGSEWLQRGIFLIVGIFVILMGTAKIALNFIPVIMAKKLDEEKKAIFRGYFGMDMIMTGVVQIIVGIIMVVLFAKGLALISMLMDVIAMALGIILIVSAGVLILFSTGFIISKMYPLFVGITYYIFSAILVGVGIFILVYVNSNPGFQRIVLIITGAILVLIGIIFAISAIREAVKAKKEKKSKENNAPIEVDAIDVSNDTEANIVAK